MDRTSKCRGRMEAPERPPLLLQLALFAVFAVSP
jgi:hypothetical protein